MRARFAVLVVAILVLPAAAAAGEFALRFASFTPATWTDCDDEMIVVLTNGADDSDWTVPDTLTFTVTGPDGTSIPQDPSDALIGLGVVFVRTTSDQPAWTPGDYALEASTIMAEEVETASLTVEYLHAVDITPPTAQAFIQSFHGGSDDGRIVDGYYVNPVYVEVTATDDCRPGSVSFRLDGASVAPVEGCSFFSCNGPRAQTVAVDVNTSGVHTVAFRPIDNAGNAGNWSSVEVRVSLHPPTVTIAQPPVFATDQTLPIVVGCGPFAAAATPDGIGLQSIRWLIDGDDSEQSGSDPILCFGSTGAHTVQAVATDNAGRQGFSNVINVTAVGTDIPPSV